MNSTSAAEVICQALAPGPGLGVKELDLSSYVPNFEFTLFVLSAPLAPLFTYASRSLTRCSRVGSARLGAASAAQSAVPGDKMAVSKPVTKNSFLIWVLYFFLGLVIS